MPDHDGAVWSHPLMSWAQGQKGLSLPAAEAGRAAVEMVSLPARAERAGVLPEWEGPSQRVRFSLFRASWVSPALPVLGGVKTEPCRGRNQPSRAEPSRGQPSRCIIVGARIVAIPLTAQGLASVSFTSNHIFHLPDKRHRGVRGDPQHSWPRALDSDTPFL